MACHIMATDLESSGKIGRSAVIAGGHSGTDCCMVGCPGYLTVTIGTQQISLLHSLQPSEHRKGK